MQHCACAQDSEGSSIHKIEMEGVLKHYQIVQTSETILRLRRST